MKKIGLVFSALAILNMAVLSKGALYADTIAAKTSLAVEKSEISGLANQDSKYFAMRPESIQVAGEAEGFSMLGGTVLIVAFIIAMGAIAITK